MEANRRREFLRFLAYSPLVGHFVTGVEQVLDLLRAEFVRTMQLAGTPSLREITPEFVQRKKDWS